MTELSPFKVVAAQAVTGGVIVTALGVVSGQAAKGRALEGDTATAEVLEAETSKGNAIEGQGFIERC